MSVKSVRAAIDRAGIQINQTEAKRITAEAKKDGVTLGEFDLIRSARNGAGATDGAVAVFNDFLEEVRPPGIQVDAALKAAIKKGGAADIRAIVRLWKPTSAATTREFVDALLKKVETKTSLKPADAVTFSNLGYFILSAKAPFLEELVKQSGLASATLYPNA